MIRIASVLLVVAVALLTASPAAPQGANGTARLKSDIVVTGQRGSAVSDIAPLATLDARAIDATGASTMGDLLRAIRSATQSSSGNLQRAVCSPIRR